MKGILAPISEVMGAARSITFCRPSTINSILLKSMGRPEAICFKQDMTESIGSLTCTRLLSGQTSKPTLSDSGILLCIIWRQFTTDLYSPHGWIHTLQSLGISLLSSSQRHHISRKIVSRTTNHRHWPFEQSLRAHPQSLFQTER